MKKSIILLFVLIVTITKSQTEVRWTLDLLNVPGNRDANIGTSSNDPLSIFTNNTRRAVFDSLGNFKVINLSGNGYRMLFADQFGNIGTVSNRSSGTVTPSQPCEISSSPWFEGGNMIGIYGSREIGTCNNQDFILKANGKKSIFITASDGHVGIGQNNSAPLGALDINDPINGNTKHTIIHGDNSGWIENTGDMQLSYTGSFALIGNGGNLLSADANGQINFGYQTNAVNLAKLNINVDANSATPINALDVFDQYTSKVNFRIKSSGLVLAREIKVNLINPWPDYVFESGYKVQSLSEVKKFVMKNKHLAGIPSQQELKANDNSINLGEIQIAQMQKIEEIYLYLFKLQEEIEMLKAENELLKNKK